MAAIVALGVTRGERGRQAVEMMIGVAVGIAVGDLLIAAIGTGTAQIALAVGLAMAAAVLLGRGQLFATQAAVSAALVATVDARRRLCAGPLPGRPHRRGDRADLQPGPVSGRPGPGGARGRRRDPGRARPHARGHRRGARRPRSGRRRACARAGPTGQRAVERLRGGGPARSRERALLAYAPPPPRPLELYEEAGHPIDLTVRDIQVLARGAARALRIGDPVPPELPEAVRDLADALRGVASHLKRPASEHQVGEVARKAAERASAVLARDENVSVSMIVAHVQATAVDALRSLGVERVEAQEEIGEVALAPPPAAARAARPPAAGDPLAPSRRTAHNGIGLARGSRPRPASSGPRRPSQPTGESTVHIPPTEYPARP